MSGVKARAHVIMDEDIVKEIDRLVGKKKRSSFISEATKKELKRLKQLSLIKKFKGVWKDEDHPELSGKEGTYKWVRKLRDEDEKVLRKKLA
ncbi:MAG: hypothetical protein FJ241_04390 [Nitrospira sp.]|nr:hypothetical protein [Nitrospira sp.]